MHLYRIITNVRAGAEHPTCSPGRPGLATVWLQSDSEEDALRQAREVIGRRRYEAVDELTIFQEESQAASSADGVEDTLASGYLKMREKALTSADGLFEIWF